MFIQYSESFVYNRKRRVTVDRGRDVSKPGLPFSMDGEETVRRAFSGTFTKRHGHGHVTSRHGHIFG
jgi:hypothetical protein